MRSISFFNCFLGREVVILRFQKPVQNSNKMIHFFGSQDTVFALQTQDNLSNEDIKKLLWLFNSQIDNKFTITNSSDSSLKAYFVGPRAAMITP